MTFERAMRTCLSSSHSEGQVGANLRCRTVDLLRKKVGGLNFGGGRACQWSAMLLLFDLCFCDGKDWHERTRSETRHRLLTTLPSAFSSQQENQLAGGLFPLEVGGGWHDEACRSCVWGGQASERMARNDGCRGETPVSRGPFCS